jgi:16S rRNA (cytosine1402-N4)-methyltransferase
LEHYPVLLEEVLDYLQVDPAGTYIDCTLGEGGYAEAILKRLTSGRLIAVDRDAQAIERAARRLKDYGDQVSLIQACYSEIAGLVRSQTPAFAPAEAPVQGIVADLGLSRRQIEEPARGFSFLRPGDLDMRMDQRQALTADQIVNHYQERQLADLIYQYGEERRSRRIARAIVRGRPVRNTVQLAEIIERAVPRAPRQKIHPATRTFQALRIAVNHELEELEALLNTAPLLLAPGGRMVVVSFHSLEDRLVKWAFRSWAQKQVLEILTKRVVTPSERETRENPASRSAKLRAAQRTDIAWRQQN